jgi:hypothetical protein
MGETAQLNLTLKIEKTWLSIGRILSVSEKNRPNLKKIDGNFRGRNKPERVSLVRPKKYLFYIVHGYFFFSNQPL